MAQDLPASDIILYIWPGQWGLPSFDPLCLAAVLELQLAIPGKFHLVQCNSPDASPAGQLPCLIHERQIITSFRSIVKYISGLSKSGSTVYPSANIDASLTPSQKAQLVAWSAHIESHLGDLVYYTLYSSAENWTGLTRRALCSMFGLPQRYYAPERLRELYKPRLEAAGLWSSPVKDEDQNKSFRKTKHKKQEEKDFHAAFEREKILEKAKSSLDIYARLLEMQKYILSDRPTTIDVILAAHILVLIKAPYPNPLIKALIQDSYSGIETHAVRVHEDTLQDTFTPIPTIRQHSALWSLLPSWPTTKKHTMSKDIDEEATQWRRINWAFFGLVLGCFTAYAVIERQAFLQLSTPLRNEEEYEEDEEFLDGSEEGDDHEHNKEDINEDDNDEDE